MNDEESGLELTNGWQNVGIMNQYAMKNVDFKLRSLFMALVQESFGYGMAKTLHKTQEHWAKKFGITKPTFNAQIKKLMDYGHIRANMQKGYVVGGGSKPQSYSPSFPSKANIWLKAIDKKSKKTTPANSTERQAIAREKAKEVSF